MVGPSSSEDLISSLDLGNTLHLQNSDFNANTAISVKLTRIENYRVWAAAMKLAINTRNKSGFINGTCLKSTYANSAALSNQWERCNSIVLSWLLNFVSETCSLVKFSLILLLRSSFLSRETLPDVNDAFAILSREESHRGIASSSSGTVVKPQVSSFMVKSNNWSNNGNKRVDNKNFGNTVNGGNNR
ncbi:ribonuclease H-like domain-containing protein, partial [Tanacetum coccineum]